MDAQNVVELQPGCSGKAQVLIQALLSTIYQPEFGDMTLAEVIGALELVKRNLMSDHDA